MQHDLPLKYTAFRFSFYQPDITRHPVRIRPHKRIVCHVGKRDDLACRDIFGPVSQRFENCKVLGVGISSFFAGGIVGKESVPGALKSLEPIRQPDGMINPYSLQPLRSCRASVQPISLRCNYRRRIFSNSAACVPRDPWDLSP